MRIKKRKIAVQIHVQREHHRRELSIGCFSENIVTLRLRCPRLKATLHREKEKLPLAEIVLFTFPGTSPSRLTRDAFIAYGKHVRYRSSRNFSWCLAIDILSQAFFRTVTMTKGRSRLSLCLATEAWCFALTKCTDHSLVFVRDVFSV